MQVARYKYRMIRRQAELNGYYVHQVTTSHFNIVVGLRNDRLPAGINLGYLSFDVPFLWVTENSLVL